MVQLCPYDFKANDDYSIYNSTAFTFELFFIYFGRIKPWR